MTAVVAFCLGAFFGILLASACAGFALFDRDERTWKQKENER